MEDLGKIYRAKIKDLLAQQKSATDEVIKLTKRIQEIEAEIERLGDEEFVRTGIFTWSETFEIKVTYKDLLEDLVKKTEGKMISPDMDEPNLN